MAQTRNQEVSKKTKSAHDISLVKGIGPGKLALSLLLLLLIGCGSYHPNTDPNQNGTLTPRTHLPIVLKQKACCQWNHSVVNGGGGQTGLAVNWLSPNIVYATMDHGGIVKSTDYGDTWQTINNNIGHLELADIQLDPLNPDIVYVTAAYCRGCGEGEMYRSSDGGANWQFITDAFGAEKWPSTRGVVIIPQDADGDQISDVIYVGAWAGIEGDNKGGVWKSSDEGTTWQQIGQVNGDAEFFKEANVWVLRSDPSNPNVLYAGMFVYNGETTPGGIFKSTDGGLNWTDITHNIPHPNVSDIAISPDGSTLYAATNTFYRSESGAGIFKSTDAGETWTTVNNGLEGTSLNFEVLLRDKDDPDVLYAGSFGGDNNGVYKTTDGAKHWYGTRVDFGDWWNTSFDNAWAIAEGADSHLYLTTWDGIYRSDDDGETWLARSQGLGNTIVYDLAIDPRNPSTIYLGLGDIGPWKSTDGGRTWTQIKEGYYEPYGRSSGGVAAFSISPGDPNIIYSAVKGSSGTTLMGVNKTVNGGQRWTAINNGLPGPEPLWDATAVVVHPSNPDVAYLGIITDASTGSVFKTTDGGASWTELEITDRQDLMKVESLVISTSNPNTVLVGTREPAHIYKTTDGGASWSKISPPAELMPLNTIVYDIDIHPHDANQIVIGVNTLGVYRTADGGQTWAHILDVEFFQGSVGDLALNPEATIHATIKTVKFDPDDSQIIYAGHDNRGRGGFGVARSTDGGESWTLIHNTHLQHRNVFAMEIQPETKELFVGGFDGVYIFERYFLSQ